MTSLQILNAFFFFIQRSEQSLKRCHSKVCRVAIHFFLFSVLYLRNSRTVCAEKDFQSLTSLEWACLFESLFFFFPQIVQPKIETYSSLDFLKHVAVPWLTVCTRAHTEQVFQGTKTHSRELKSPLCHAQICIDHVETCKLEICKEFILGSFCFIAQHLDNVFFPLSFLPRIEKEQSP